MTRSPGRPRSEETRRAILAASVAAVDDEGYGRLTMEGLARRAGVSKQTIYRWWPTKGAVVLEALIEGAREAAPARDSGSFEADLRRLVRDTVSAVSSSAGLLSALMAEAQLDDRFGKEFRQGFLAGRRAVLREIL